MQSTTDNSATTTGVGFNIPRRVGRTVGLVLPLLVTAIVLVQQLQGVPIENWWSWSIKWELLALVFLLSPVNWSFEILKWAELLPYGSTARRKREVLYGVAWSMVGPLRMGAIVGRVSATRKNERNQGMRAFATASAAQCWCTVTGAAIAILFMGMIKTGAALVVVSIASFSLYLNWSPKFWKLLRKMQITGDWRLAHRIPKARRKTILQLSIGRYLVMIAQFVLVLNAFRHQESIAWFERYLHQILGGPVTWGLTSLAPTAMFGELGLREAAALIALPASTTQDTTAIIGAMLSLWVANLLLPALYGLYLQNQYRNSPRHHSKLQE